jgi:competence protein ComGC
MQRKGFTLIEALLMFSILSILFMAVIVATDPVSAMCRDKKNAKKEICVNAAKERKEKKDGNTACEPLCASGEMLVFKGNRYCEMGPDPDYYNR